jgi:Cu2+-exporting ATPase
MINREIAPFVVWIWSKEAALPNSKMVYTCPMHPEVVQEGVLVLYGMDLVPMEPTESEENKVYNDFVK